MMIRKNLDVKDLVSSDLFFPPIWENKTIFAEDPELQICPFNMRIVDLEYESPYELFNDQHIFKKNKVSKHLSDSRPGLSMATSETEVNEESKEKHEMQFNYVYVGKIQGENKTELMRYLSQSDDLDIFQQEAIQVIIDYKWDTYTKRFFLKKLLLYFIFLLNLYIDIDIVFIDERREREKDIFYFLRKAFGIIIQGFFFTYEMQQLYIAGHEYFFDLWNYFELGGIALYSIAVFEDYYHDIITDQCKMFYVFTILFGLVKVLFLVRVFKNLSFLVMMVI